MLVFISHSTRPDAQGDKAYLDTLEQALRAEFTVLLDRASLEGGQEWPREIDGYMARCHAAVILFSRSALKSDWVIKEAAILNWRRSLSQDFLLMPVALEGVSPSEFRNDHRFAPMDLKRWQFIKSGTPEEVTERILSRCRKHSPPPNSTPLERLVVKLTGMLEGARKAELEAAAWDLGHPIPEWNSGGRSVLAERIARQLIEADSQGVHPIVRKLAPVIGRTQALRLLKCIKPLWVDPEAAGKIPPIADNRKEAQAIGLNGKNLFKFTARSYLDRAYWGDAAVQLIPVDGAVGQQAFEEIERQIAQYLSAKGIDPENQAYYLETTENPFFVLLPRPVPEPDVLDRLQERFSRMTFILTTGEAEHDDPRVAAHDRLIMLEPRLKLEVERAAWKLHKDLELMLGNLEG
jgi:hypothetical protein